MSPTHRQQTTDYNRAFAVGVGLNVAFVAIEAICGFLCGSLALLADAAHNLSDVAGLLIAWGGAALAARDPTPRRTYGFRRVTILAALASAGLLLVVLGGVLWESVRRLFHPEPVEGVVVIAVAAIGVVINSATAWMFMSGSKHDLNIRGAFLHMAADAAVSLGVVLAGTGIILSGWVWLDPAMSIVIAFVILVGTWHLLRDSLGLATDCVPRHIDPTQVREYLLALPRVERVHDLHIWALSTTEIALTAHLVTSQTPADDDLLVEASRNLESRFGIHHVTLQVEGLDTEARCKQAAPGSL